MLMDLERHVPLLGGNAAIIALAVRAIWQYAKCKDARFPDSARIGATTTPPPARQESTEVQTHL
jgi:hypothetical protein